jgi:lipid II:glycine glycyltransferase (peptidoglycan interpeptide bridge formation enzyme)
MIFALGFIIGKDFTKKRAINFLMKRLSKDLSEHKIKLVKTKPHTKEDERKLKNLINS